VIFQASLWVCFTTSHLLSEHLDNDEVFDFMRPLLIAMASIGLVEQGQKPLTLALAINPLQGFSDNPRYQEFNQTLKQYRANTGPGNSGASTNHSWFAVLCLNRLKTKYGADFSAVYSR
jgi:hypothetical protein